MENFAPEKIFNAGDLKGLINAMLNGTIEYGDDEANRVWDQIYKLYEHDFITGSEYDYLMRYATEL